MENTTTNRNQSPEGQTDCIIDYGQKIFYRREGQPYLVKPVVMPSQPGFFTAEPRGLDLDRDTGEIDVNTSYTGNRYRITFTSCDKKCVASTQVVISGVNYAGRIFSLADPNPEAWQSTPYYNGDVCTKGIKGEFGILPEGRRRTADLQGLIFVDLERGIVDLKATIESGALGFRKNPQKPEDAVYPENGASKEFTIYYRLKEDDSGGTLNSTTIRIHFFDSEKDIPPRLLNRVRRQQQSAFLGIPVYLPFALLLSSFAPSANSIGGLLTALAASAIPLVLLMSGAPSTATKPREHIGTR